LEADLLACNFNGLTPIEIKASMTFSKDFGKAFTRLRKASDTIKAGYVIYAGDLEAEVSGTRFINFTKTEKVIREV